MREDHSKNRDRCLQDRSKTGRHVELSPKKKRVIDRKHEYAGKCEDAVIRSTFREQTSVTN